MMRDRPDGEISVRRALSPNPPAAATRIPIAPTATARVGEGGVSLEYPSTDPPRDPFNAPYDAKVIGDYAGLTPPLPTRDR